MLLTWRISIQFITIIVLLILVAQWRFWRDSKPMMTCCIIIWLFLTLFYLLLPDIGIIIVDINCGGNDIDDQPVIAYLLY